MEPVVPAKPAVSTKQKILETAIDLFSRNGYSAVSVREITKQVGIKESALYNHFKTKDEILESIYTLFRNELSLKGLPPTNKLNELLEQMSMEQFLMRGFTNYQQSVNPPLSGKIWAILNIEQFRDPRARKIILDDVFEGTIDFLEAAFKILMSKGKMKPFDPRLLAFEYQYPMFTVMTEYLLLKQDKQDTSDLEKRVKEHIQFFIHNVKPPL